MKWKSKLVSISILILCASQLHSEPTTKSDETAAVAKGDITATISVEGYFQPIDPQEIRIAPKAYQGDLKIKSAAGEGSAVKKGDVILQIDATELNQQLAEADNAVASAQANFTKAQSDESLGKQSDDLAVKMAQTELANAQNGLNWWDDVEGKQMLNQAELSVKEAKGSVEDQSDELDQLKKMYKTEDLTNATSEIVIKRALRSLEISKTSEALTEDRAKKVKEFDFANARQAYLYTIDQKKQAMDQAQAQQQAQAELRKAGTITAKLALDAAQDKATKLKADLDLFTVAAQTDGVVYCGQLQDGAWQNAEPEKLKPGEKATAGQVVMMLVAPGKLRVAAKIPESKESWVSAGTTAHIVPIALPEASCDGTCSQLADASQSFKVLIDPATVDARLTPGMKADVRINASSEKDVLVVPVDAVSEGRVKVRESGKDAWRDVVVGKSDGEKIEITQGLKEGEQVLVKAGK